MSYENYAFAPMALQLLPVPSGQRQETHTVRAEIHCGDREKVVSLTVTKNAGEKVRLADWVEARRTQHPGWTFECVLSEEDKSRPKPKRRPSPSPSPAPTTRPGPAPAPGQTDRGTGTWTY